jgi:hypothetical protein
LPALSYPPQESQANSIEFYDSWILPHHDSNQ